MSSYRPDPSVFSDVQWAEIARSIGLDQISVEAKQQICDALFEYTLAEIRPEQLERFIKEAQKFREAASKVQNFLRRLSWLKKVEELIEDIYQLERIVASEFERRPKPKGGRPPSAARDSLIDRLISPYERLTGNKAGRSENPETKEMTGPFPRFVTTIFQLHGISLKGLKNAIAKAVANAKNRH